MTTILSPEEIRFPSTRWPNNVVPVPVAQPPVDAPYIVGQPWLSVEDWTPQDHYAGPAPIPGMATPAWARKSIKSSEVPILRPAAARAACRGGASGPIYRDFYASGPAAFWPCTRESMEQVGMNRELKVEPIFNDLGTTQVADAGKALAVAAVAGVATYFFARSVLRSR